MLLNLEIFTQFFHHLVVEVRLVVCDDLIWDFIPIDDFLLQEASHHFLCDICIRDCIHPFSEVVDGHEDEAMLV